MKINLQYKIAGIITLALSSLSAYAQAKNQTIEIDALTKVIGGLFTIGGFVMAYMQLKMANQISDVKAKFTAELTFIKDSVDKKIDDEVAKLRVEISKVQVEVKISQKEIEAKMATHHDIANMRQLNILQGEVTKEQLNGLKKQLQNAAEMALVTGRAAAQAAVDAVRDFLKSDRK